MNDKESLKQWIKKQRLQNYGYDYPYFKKMSSYKARILKKLEKTPDVDVRKALAKEGILGKGRRLTKTRLKSGKKVWDYTTGQSFNEELLNIATIGATKGKKSFWESSEGWSY